MERDTTQSDQGREATAKPEQQADPILFFTRIKVDLSEIKPDKGGFMDFDVQHGIEADGSITVEVGRCQQVYFDSEIGFHNTHEVGEVSSDTVIWKREAGTGDLAFVDRQRFCHPSDARTLVDYGLQEDSEEGGA